MISMTDDTPRWIRELHRFIKIKSLLFVHGNILDLVSYPLTKPNGDIYWCESDIGDFLQRYLSNEGYEVVGKFDPIDGLQFATDAVKSQFDTTVSEQRKQEGKAKGEGWASAVRRPSGASDSLADMETAVRDINTALSNRSTPCAFVFNFASRLVVSPDRLSRQEMALFTRLLKATLQSREVINDKGRWNNVVLFVCDKLNDIPAFMYFNNPRTRSIAVEHPSASDRKRFLNSNYSGFFQDPNSTPNTTPDIIPSTLQPNDDLAGLFSVLTEGFSYYELLSLIGLSQREKIPLDRIQTLCERYKYGVVESDWDKLDHQRLANAGTLIRERIKGQEPAVIRLLEIVKRAKLGIAAGTSQKSQRPRGVLFFAGPTGVGKTEMAKGLAELLFGKEERLIRFDMSEYSSAHADQKLLGSPPGYVGYEEGGKLTNAMKEQPYSVLLFDEIEKAHSSIFDKFLQILDDGRLTDGKGETVYFSECIIIFTSNRGTISTLEDGSKGQVVDHTLPYQSLRQVILTAIRDHFNYGLGRPEILNRFGDNFVVFDFIREPHDEAIVQHLLSQLKTTVSEQKGIALEFSSAVKEALSGLAKSYLIHGGRGIRNMFDAALVNPLATLIFDHNIQRGEPLTLTALKDHGETADHRFELDYERHQQP